MAKQKPITKDIVNKISSEMSSLPPKNKFTLEGLIIDICPQITQLLKDGYSRTEVVDIIRKYGFELKESTFNIYYRKAKAAQKAALKNNPEGNE